VVSLPDPSGVLAAALAERGAVVAGRAGRVRIAFHLWNDEADVELAADALASTGLTANVQ
jgi:selenocysteine lyase/cysteine desulfurase